MSHNPQFLEIIQGEDRLLILRINRADCIPYILTGITDLRVRFRKAIGGYLEKVLGPDVVIVDPYIGKISVQLSETETPLLLVGERLDFTVLIDTGLRATATSVGTTYTAVNTGTTGNSIVLVFDGVLTITTVVTAWNTAHPTNTVSFSGNPGSTIPAVSTITLSGGTNNKRLANFYRSLSVKKQAV